jgi:hypothetical protein
MDRLGPLLGEDEMHSEVIAMVTLKREFKLTVSRAGNGFHDGQVSVFKAPA